MKDAYWLAVDNGVSEEAKDLGVTMHLVEAGGYTNLSKQISQIEDCASNGAQAVVIGAISYDGLNETAKRLKEKNIPVIDVINGMGESFGLYKIGDDEGMDGALKARAEYKGRVARLTASLR